MKKFKLLVLVLLLSVHLVSAQKTKEQRIAEIATTMKEFMDRKNEVVYTQYISNTTDDYETLEKSEKVLKGADISLLGKEKMEKIALPYPQAGDSVWITDHAKDMLRFEIKLRKWFLSLITCQKTDYDEVSQKGKELEKNYYRKFQYEFGEVFVAKVLEQNKDSAAFLTWRALFVYLDIHSDPQRVSSFSVEKVIYSEFGKKKTEKIMATLEDLIDKRLDQIAKAEEIAEEIKVKEDSKVDTEAMIRPTITIIAVFAVFFLIFLIVVLIG